MRRKQPGAESNSTNSIMLTLLVQAALRRTQMFFFFLLEVKNLNQQLHVYNKLALTQHVQSIYSIFYMFQEVPLIGLRAIWDNAFIAIVI